MLNNRVLTSIEKVLGRFFKRLNKEQWALVFSAVVLFTFIVLSFVVKLQSTPAEIRIELLQETPEPKKENEKEKEEAEATAKNPLTNQAYNSSAKQRFAPPPPMVNNRKAIDRLKQNLQGEDGIATDYQLKFNALNNKEVLYAADTLQIPDEVNNIKKDTRIWYSLANRFHRHIAVPIYTCDSAGKVAVNILVSPAGNVMETSIDIANSTTTNGCLLENAQEYARKTTFNPGKEGMQWGTIYYLFTTR